MMRELYGSPLLWNGSIICRSATAAESGGMTLQVLLELIEEADGLQTVPAKRRAAS